MTFKIILLTTNIILLGYLSLQSFEYSEIIARYQWTVDTLRLDFYAQRHLPKTKQIQNDVDAILKGMKQ